MARSSANQTSAALYVLFMGILFFAPLAFGTVELWSLTFVELGTALLGLLLFFQLLGKKDTAVAVPGLLPLVLLLLWMLIQLIPLPPRILELLSPGTYAVYEPVINIAAEDSWIPLSINPKSTLYEFLRITSYALFYICTIQFLSNSRTLQKTVTLLVGLAIGIAFLAIIQKYTSSGLIYWYRSSPVESSFGPWVYRNHYSGFMAMMLPLVLGLLLYYRPRLEKEVSFREKVVAFFSTTNSSKQLILAFGWIIIFSSIFLALSRGGIIATLLSLLLFYIVYSRKKGSRSWPVITVFIGGVCLFFYSFGAEGILSRINDTFTPEGQLVIDRFDTWRDVKGIISTFWLTGTGFGTFVDIFPAFKTLANPYVYDHVHNDYLELITDGGIVGFGLAAWFVVAVIRHSWKMLGKRRENFSIAIGTGALAGIFAILCFSFSDFNMHNGANGLYFFFLCGLLVSCGNTRFFYSVRSTLLDTMSGKWRVGSMLISIVLVAGIFFFPLQGIIARQSFKEIEGIYLSRQLSESTLLELYGKAKRISSHDPLEGNYLMLLGDIEYYLGNNQSALEYYLQAAKKSPMRGEFLQKVALMLPAEKAELAEELMKLSYQWSVQKSTMMLNYAEWLLWRGDKERASAVLREGLEQDPQLFDNALILLIGHFSDEEVARILPERVGVWINYGKVLEELGQLEQSEFFRSRALDFLENEEIVKSRWYTQLYSFFKKQDKTDEAMDVLRKAVVSFPENVGFHLALGDYYYKQGIYYRAKELYEQILIFSPDNKAAKERLKRFED